MSASNRKDDGVSPTKRRTSERVGAQGDDGEENVGTKVASAKRYQKRRKCTSKMLPQALDGDLREELEFWKVDCNRLQQEMEGLTFALNISKKEVATLKKALKDLAKTKNAEIQRLKRDMKADSKKHSDEKKGLERIQKSTQKELDETNKDLKVKTRKLTEANLGVVSLNHDVKALQRENKTLQSSLSKVMAKLEDQVDVKSKRAIELEKLRLSREEAKASNVIATNLANEKKAEVEHFRRRELMKMQSDIRVAEKEKIMKKKEEAKQKLLEEQNGRLRFASNMMRSTINENGGSFRDLGNSKKVSTR